MKKLIILCIIMISFFTKGHAQYDQLASDFSFIGVDGKAINLVDYKEKVIDLSMNFLPNDTSL